MKKGQLNRRVTILRASSVDDGTATVAGVFASVGSRWAKRTDVSDGERARAAQQGQSLSARFLVQADALTRTINGRDVLRCDGSSFEVTGTKEWGERAEGIEIATVTRPDQPQ